MTKSVPAPTNELERVRESLRRLERHELARDEPSPVEGCGQWRLGILDAIRAALSRLDDGTYGACVACGRWIEAPRLEAIPYAQRCLSCQRDTERAG